MSFVDGKTHCEFCNHVANEVAALRHEVAWYRKKLEQSQTERYRLERELGRTSEQSLSLEVAALDPLVVEQELNLAIPCGRQCGAACG